MLSGVEAIHMATVLEDCVDQLAILGRIMPATYRNRPDAESVKNKSKAEHSSTFVAQHFIPLKRTCTVIVSNRLLLFLDKNSLAAEH